MVARQILHVDMDAFYAAVEQRDDPSLLGKPVLVGGPSRRGVVAAASYEARRFGVRSAMPMAEALRRCPEAVVLAGRRERYAEVSRQVFTIFGGYTPLVEGLSLDEAFLDVTRSRDLFGDGAAIARRIKADIHEQTGLTASAGVAPCKFAAKIASDLRKPDGLVVVPTDVAGFLSPLPIERMWGAGPKAAATLRADGLASIGDLAAASDARLERLVGASWGAHFKALARGVDDRPVVPDREAVSVGAEETYDEDLSAREELERRLLALSERVAGRLTRARTSGRVVVVKLKYEDFTLKTRRVTVPEPVSDTDSLYRAALALLERFELAGRRVRLLGVTVSGLSGEAAPRTLFPDEGAARRRRLQAVVGELRDRFGEHKIVRATLLGEED